MKSISIITFNAWKCDGDYPRRLELMAAQLGVIAPDIVLLQGAFKDERGEYDTAAYLARQLNLNCSLHQAR